MRKLLLLTAFAFLVFAPALHAQESGLVFYSPMEEVSVGFVRDISGNNNHLKMGAGTDLADGPMGKALVLTGKGGSLVPDSPTLRSIKNGLTVSFWLRLDTDAFRWTSFVKKDASTPATGNAGPTAYRPFRGFNFGTSGSSGLTKIKDGINFLFTVDDGAGGRETVSAPMARYAEPGRWIYLAATYNPAPRDRGLRLFINGELVADAVMIDMPTDISTATPLTIGYDLTGFTGALDELRVYNRPLAEAEIKKAYESFKK